MIPALVTPWLLALGLGAGLWVVGNGWLSSAKENWKLETEIENAKTQAETYRREAEQHRGKLAEYRVQTETARASLAAVPMDDCLRRDLDPHLAAAIGMQRPGTQNPPSGSRRKANADPVRVDRR